MRLKSKIVEIPTNATISQMESALDNHLNTDWILVQIFNHASKTYAILTKIIAK